MKRIINVNVAASYEEYLQERYMSYLENLGSNINFDDDKWICDKKKRMLSETNHNVTICALPAKMDTKKLQKTK